MNLITRSIITFCLFIPFLSCAQNKQTNTEAPQTVYHKISAEEAKKMLDANPHILLVDVRSEAEYKGKHIKSAILLPLPEIKSKAASMLPDKDAIIMVYCQSGMRSKSAANQLIAMGYTQIYDIGGGISSWSYETEAN